MTETPTGEQPVSFEKPVSTPAMADSSLFLLGDESWDGVRDAGIVPQFCSVLDDSVELRSEFMEGATLLGLVGKRKTLKPQQLLVADVLNAGMRFTGVLLPRRSAKTTTLFAWAFGRCLGREDYLIGYTACTTGKKARDRFLKDIVPVLERMFPEPASRPFRIRKAAGQERIEFDNGSIFQILKPSGEDFRSDAYDVIILDEAGEATPEMGADIIEAALPTQDTRDNPMLVYAGTAAKYRAGNLLWDALEDGRAGKASTGILEFSAGEFVTADDLDDWGIVEELVVACHPGIGTLTTLEAVRTNWEKLKRDQFSREYLSVFGLVGMTGGLLDMAKWDGQGIDGKLPSPPEKFALAIAAHPDQQCASIVAAWRDDDVACLLLLDHRLGVDWLADAADKLAKKYKTGIVHDSRGVVMVEVEQIQRKRPRPKLQPQTTRNVTTAAGLLVKEVDVENVRHWNQPELTAAARVVRKRKILGSWGLGRGTDTDDITAIEAGALALRAFDESDVQRSLLTISIAS